MAKIFIILILLYYSVKTSTDYEYDILDEFIPKTIIDANSDKIFKYHLSCKDERKAPKIYFQVMTNDYFYLLLYDDLNKIYKVGNFYKNYTSISSFYYYNNNNIIFNNLTCNKDNYFIIYQRFYDINEQYFYQISIVNEETNIFNLSQLLSPYYFLFPRESNKKESFYFSFNETKYALITFDGFIKIKENEEIIYNDNKSNVFEFKKDLKYYINYTSNSPIFIQFYNESTYFKYNKKDFPIILYGHNKEYFVEIDISDYEIGEYILLHTFHRVDYYIKYQYKKDFRQNNFINLEINEGFNYIPIKKNINDSSLILSIKYKSILTNLLSILNIVKDHVMEIDSNFDFNSTVKGPKFLFLDIYKFNNLKSFAIESNKKFAFFEFAEENKFHLERKKYNNFYLSRQNGEKPLLYKRGFIYLNSTDNWQLTIKKLNFSIIEKLYKDPGQEYLDLCHGEEPKTELYYYKSNYYFLEFFTPVLGNFDSFIMDERDVKTLSDFDFNKINETNVFMGEYQTGFFKIVCKKPTLIKHSYVDRSYVGSTIYSGHNYFLINRKSISFDVSDLLKGNIITFRFSIVGAKNNYQAELNLNGTKYTLSFIFYLIRTKTNIYFNRKFFLFWL